MLREGKKTRNQFKNTKLKSANILISVSIDINTLIQIIVNIAKQSDFFKTPSKFRDVYKLYVS